MTTLGIFVFSLFIFSILLDEVAFQRKKINTLETKSTKIWHILHLSFLALSVCWILLVPFSTTYALFFGGCIAISTLTLTLKARGQGKDTSPNERWLHSWIHMFHLLAVLTLGAMWPFINGVSFILDMFIPFNTQTLRPICLGFLISIGVTAILTGLKRKKTSSHQSNATITEYPTDTFHSPAPDRQEP